MRRYFRNKLKSALTLRCACEKSGQSAVKTKDVTIIATELYAAQAEEKTMRHLTTTIDTLVSWMEHDVFNKPGSNIIVRRELFDFIVKELETLAKIHPHRIRQSA